MTELCFANDLSTCFVHYCNWSFNAEFWEKLFVLQRKPRLMGQQPLCLNQWVKIVPTCKKIYVSAVGIFKFLHKTTACPKMMNYSKKHSKLFVYPITCHKWNLETLLSSLIGCQRITCSKIIHLSFFTWFVRGTNNTALPIEFVNGEYWSPSRGQKTGQICIVYHQKHIHPI